MLKPQKSWQMKLRFQPISQVQIFCWPFCPFCSFVLFVCCLAFANCRGHTHIRAASAIVSNSCECSWLCFYELLVNIVNKLYFCCVLWWTIVVTCECSGSFCGYKTDSWWCLFVLLSRPSFGSNMWRHTWLWIMMMLSSRFSVGVCSIVFRFLYGTILFALSCYGILALSFGYVVSKVIMILCENPYIIVWLFNQSIIHRIWLKLSIYFSVLQALATEK